MDCSTRFVNFHDAECAIDSTAIRFFIPKEEIEQKKTADMKNKVNGQKLQAAVNPRGIAIHINTDHPRSIHDKRLYDVSGLPVFLTVTRGKQKIILPVLADRGYISIESYHKSAIAQQRGSEEETINRNNDIAVDRQIVERHYGRFKGIKGNYERWPPWRQESTP